MRNAYADLIEITELLHARVLTNYKARSEDVQKTERSLEEIRLLRKAAQSDTGSIDARRVTGADVMWQGWLALRTTRLQQEMAINKALQLEELANARRSFAKLDAAQSLQRQEQKARQAKALTSHLDSLDWLATMRAWSRR